MSLGLFSAEFAVVGMMSHVGKLKVKRQKSKVNRRKASGFYVTYFLLLNLTFAF
jgi:hypothetical protein